MRKYNLKTSSYNTNLILIREETIVKELKAILNDKFTLWIKIRVTDICTWLALIIDYNSFKCMQCTKKMLSYKVSRIQYWSAIGFT